MSPFEEIMNKKFRVEVTKQFGLTVGKGKELFNRFIAKYSNISNLVKKL